MNVSRNIPSAFWSDEKVAEFNTEDKLFFLYLLTNANTKQVGVYKVSPRQMSFDSGLSPEAIETLMKRFEDEYGLIQYDSSSREICILNWGKFNFKKGGKPVEDLIKKELRDVTRLDFAEIVARKIPSEKVRTAVLNAIENELTNRGTNRHTNREEVAITTETTNRHTNRGTNRESIGETPFEEPQKYEETLIQSDFTNRGTNRHTNRETVESEERISEDLTNRGTNRHTNRKEEEKKNTGRKSHNTKRLQTIKNEALEMTDEVFELLELWRAKRGTASDYILDQVKDSIQIYGVEKVREVMERMAAPIHFMVFEEELEK